MAYSSGGGSSNDSSWEGSEYTRNQYYVPDESSVKPLSRGRAIICFCLLMSMICGAPMMLYQDPKPVAMDYSDTAISVDDQEDLLTDNEENQLQNALHEFQRITGVTPSILLMSEKVYAETGNTSLEEYAEILYDQKFDDEKHWLIVYEQSSTGRREEWEYEGMQGDDTGSALTSNVTSSFNNRLTYLLNSDDYTTGRAFTDAFGDLNQELVDEMSPDRRDGILLYFLSFPVGLAVIIVIVRWIRSRRK